MYQVTGQGLALLDTMALEEGLLPRVDGHSQQVCIPGGLLFPGVSVVRWEDNRLTTPRTLECVGKCYSVGVISPQTLGVCDSDSRSVSVVSVTDDRVTATLRKPEVVEDETPDDTAVLGDSVLVRYGSSMVVYENGVSSTGTMVPTPMGLQSVYSMSSDGVSRFLVCDEESNTVFVLDVKGKLCDKINIDTDSRVEDCKIVDGKLWVGCYNGDIVVLSP